MAERLSVGDVVAVPGQHGDDPSYHVARVVDVNTLHYPSPHVGSKTFVKVDYADGRIVGQELDTLQHAAAIRMDRSTWSGASTLTRAEAERHRHAVPQYGHTL